MLKGLLAGLAAAATLAVAPVAAQTIVDEWASVKAPAAAPTRRAVTRWPMTKGRMRSMILLLCLSLARQTRLMRQPQTST